MHIMEGVMNMIDPQLRHQGSRANALESLDPPFPFLLIVGVSLVGDDGLGNGLLHQRVARYP